MERLTEQNPCWIDDEFWTAAREPDDGEITDVYLKLKAYEDTGLEPEEVPTGLELANVYAAMLLLKQYQGLGTVDEFHAALRRVAEDDKAREEGRLVRLPCKVGDMVYWMWTDGAGNCEAPIYEDQIYEICITENGVELSRGPHDGGLGMIGIHPHRAVFLTRREEEAALSERGGEE